MSADEKLAYHTAHCHDLTCWRRRDVTRHAAFMWMSKQRREREREQRETEKKEGGD